MVILYILCIRYCLYLFSSYTTSKSYLKYHFIKKPLSWLTFPNYHCVLILIYIIYSSIAYWPSSLSISCVLISIFFVSSWFPKDENSIFYCWVWVLIDFCSAVYWRADFKGMTYNCGKMMFGSSLRRALNASPSQECMRTGCQFCTLLFPQSLVQYLSYGGLKKIDYFNKLFYT